MNNSNLLNDIKRFKTDKLYYNCEKIITKCWFITQACCYKFKLTL